MRTAHKRAMSHDDAGDRATWLGYLCAVAWLAVVLSTGYAYFGVAMFQVPTVMALGAVGMGPVVFILMGALAARDAARARGLAVRIARLAEDGFNSPLTQSATDARELAASLRGEVEALDSIVHVTARRLDAFEGGLREDGGVLARALADDIETMGQVRQTLNAETNAIGDAIGRHVAALRETTALVGAETRTAAAALETQLEAFGEASARIGARSAEFAAAAAHSAGSAHKLDAAVEKALQALAHATSLTESAPRSYWRMRR